MTGRPIYCGRDHAGRACLNLAAVVIDASGRHTLACTDHRAAAERWAATGGRVTVTPAPQPEDAIAGDGQATLFDLANPG